MAHDVAVFTGTQLDQYRTWLEAEQEKMYRQRYRPWSGVEKGCVFNLTGADYGVLHSAGCPSVAPRASFKSVGKPKVCGQLSDLRRWARESGYTFLRCEHCQGG